MPSRYPPTIRPFNDLLAGEPARRGCEVDELWRPSRWLDPPARPPASPPVGEAVLGMAVVAYHLADFRVLPGRTRLLGHLAAAVVTVGGALALRASPAELGLRTDRLGRGLVVGLVSGLVTGAVLAAGAATPRTRGAFADERARGQRPREVARNVLVDIPLGTVVYEEAVFRGALLGLALRRTTPLRAAGLGALAFGLWHVQPALDSRDGHPVTAAAPAAGVVAGTVAATAVAGLAFTWLRLRGASVLAPMVAHLATNAGAYLSAVVLDRSA